MDLLDEKELISDSVLVGNSMSYQSAEVLIKSIELTLSSGFLC